MSTRCGIGQRNDEGGASVIVVGIDGFPSFTGLLLADYYGLGEQGARRRRRLFERYGDCYIDYRKLITIEPGKRAGKPCIRGMRITVDDVLDYLSSGMTHQEILDELPYLREEDILACLSYAADREVRC